MTESDTFCSCVFKNKTPEVTGQHLEARWMFVRLIVSKLRTAPEGAL